MLLLYFLQGHPLPLMSSPVAEGQSLTLLLQFVFQAKFNHHHANRSSPLVGVSESLHCPEFYLRLLFWSGNTMRKTTNEKFKLPAYL